ncbi:hypothetical protein A0H81_00654 [Grifola frondosa]|uniref:Uncharacterized protein n=1 Tax=Grifola frondosa TaxID=5627 RepID=A0A1C7MRB3_GRIFR|nr:hypothetical protein A0H81_00654 [Grifola frondosa]
MIIWSSTQSEASAAFAATSMEASIAVRFPESLAVVDCRRPPWKSLTKQLSRAGWSSAPGCGNHAGQDSWENSRILIPQSSTIIPP